MVHSKVVMNMQTTLSNCIATCDTVDVKFVTHEDTIIVTVPVLTSQTDTTNNNTTQMYIHILEVSYKLDICGNFTVWAGVC